MCSVGSAFVMLNIYDTKPVIRCLDLRHLNKFSKGEAIEALYTQQAMSRIRVQVSVGSKRSVVQVVII